MKWIRLPGVIGFALIGALIAGILFFAMGPIIKTSIEVAGSKMAGAKVDVGKAQFSVAPLGVTLHQVTVADAESPMRNAFEFDEARARLQLGPLILGKGIVESLVVDNLQFDTERTESGALAILEQDVSGEATKTNDDENPLSLDGTLPSAEELLAREPLKTDSAAQSTQQAFTTHKEKVNNALQNLPDEAALKQYETDIKTITSGNIESLEDFNARKQKLDALKQRMAADKQAIVDARNTVNTARKEVTSELSALKSAPSEDIAMLRSKYQLNAGGAANLASLLLGEEVGEWAKKGVYWYEKIQPYLNGGSSDTNNTEKSEAEESQRKTGAFVHFPTDDPWPDFLIRKLSISAPVDAGGFMKIIGKDITHQQSVLQRPMRFTITGESLNNVDALTAEATLDHRQSPSKDSLTLNIQGYDLKDVDLKAGNSKLDSAQMALDGDVVITDGQLESNADTQITEANFQSDGTSVLAKEMGRALSSISEFTINAKAVGDVYTPSVSISSDLDERLKSIMKGRLNERQKALETQLTQKLQDKVSGYLGEHNEALQQWDQADQSLGDRLATLEQLAQQEMADFRQQQQDKAKQKAKDELSKKLKGLF